MATDRRLVAKGQNEPFQALIEQSRYQGELALQHAVALAEHNWTSQQTAELLAEVAALDTEKNRQIDERSSAKQTTRDEAGAISEAKALVNRIRNIARQVVRKNADAGVTIDEFNAGGPLRRVAGRISEHLGRLRVPAAKLDVAFARISSSRSSRSSSTARAPSSIRPAPPRRWTSPRCPRTPPRSTSARAGFSNTSRT